MNTLMSRESFCCGMCSSSDASFRLFNNRYCSRQTPRRIIMTSSGRWQGTIGKIHNIRCRCRNKETAEQTQTVPQENHGQTKYISLLSFIVWQDWATLLGRGFPKMFYRKKMLFFVLCNKLCFDQACSPKRLDIDFVFLFVFLYLSFVSPITREKRLLANIR